MSREPQRWIRDLTDQEPPTNQAHLYWIGLQKHGATYVVKPLNDLEVSSTRQLFFDAIRRAEKRLWILDKKFDSAALSVIWDEIFISRIPDIRILAEKASIDSIRLWVEDLKAKREEMIIVDRYRIAWKNTQQVQWNTSALSRSPGQLHQFLLRILPGVSSRVHDRFALVDDELWHFGSTVGALEDQGFSAVSRGWYIEAEEFVQLFTQCLWRDK